jgi:hypothetical protein
MRYKRTLQVLRNDSSLKKTALAVITLLMLAIGLTFLVHPVKAFSANVLSSSGYLDIIGGYMIHGEVQNLDSTPLSGVWVSATYYDNNNNAIAEGNGPSFLDVILPNQKSAFTILLWNETQWDTTKDATQQLGSRVDHYTLAVNYTFAREATARPLGLNILSSSVQLYENGYGMNITGEIENTAATAATYPKICATFYDSDGKVAYTAFTFADPYGDPPVVQPGQRSPFALLLLREDAEQAKSYVLSAESIEYSSLESSSLPLPTFPPFTPTPSAGPTSTSTSPPTVAQLLTVAWVPPPQNAAAATAATAVAVGVVSVVVAAATNPVGPPAGKASDLIPDSVKKWLEEFMSQRRRSTLDQKTGSALVPTKAEALAYGVSLILLTLAFSYVKVPDFTQILVVLPTILATAVIVEFAKTFSTVAFARSLGVWTEHRLWYLGLSMFLITTFAFGVPFSSPSRTMYYSPKLTKRREGIAYSAAILITLAFGALFFVLLLNGFTLIGSTGLAMCVIMAFLDTFPVSPMNGKAIYAYSKAAWAVIFAATLAIYVSWLILV